MDFCDPGNLSSSPDLKTLKTCLYSMYSKKSIRLLSEDPFNSRA